MIFDEVYGLPKPTGASDYFDSSHLAGLLAVMNHPQQVNCTEYVVNKRLDRDIPIAEYTRWPGLRVYDFSRDQATMLLSGLLAQGKPEYVNLSWIDGKDILPPSVRGLEAIAKTGKASWPSHWWLKREIQWHSTLQPLEEPFQIIALCISYDRAHGTKYLKLWTDSNKLWKWSIRRYLCQLDGEWRDEKELAEFVIQKIEGIIGG
jgi:hypothetical protein